MLLNQENIQSTTQSSFINHKRVLRIMRTHNLLARIRSKNPYKDIHKKTEEHTEVPNILKRQFKQIDTPESIYGTDITYMETYHTNASGQRQKTWMYLSVMKDMST